MTNQLQSPPLEQEYEADDTAARALGPANQNQSVGSEDREGGSKSDLSEGPKLLENGCFGPARYPTRSREVETKSGAVMIIKNVREDR